MSIFPQHSQYAVALGYTQQSDSTASSDSEEGSYIDDDSFSSSETVLSVMEDDGLDFLGFNPEDIMSSLGADSDLSVIRDTINSVLVFDSEKRMGEMVDDVDSDLLKVFSGTVFINRNLVVL